MLGQCQAWCRRRTASDPSPPFPSLPLLCPHLGSRGVHSRATGTWFQMLPTSSISFRSSTSLPGAISRPTSPADEQQTGWWQLAGSLSGPTWHAQQGEGELLTVTLEEDGDNIPAWMGWGRARSHAAGACSALPPGWPHRMPVRPAGSQAMPAAAAQELWYPALAGDAGRGGQGAHMSAWACRRGGTLPVPPRLASISSGVRPGAKSQRACSFSALNGA